MEIDNARKAKIIETEYSSTEDLIVVADEHLNILMNNYDCMIHDRIFENLDIVKNLGSANKAMSHLNEMFPQGSVSVSLDKVTILNLRCLSEIIMNSKAHLGTGASYLTDEVTAYFEKLKDLLLQTKKLEALNMLNQQLANKESPIEMLMFLNTGKQLLRDDHRLLSAERQYQIQLPNIILGMTELALKIKCEDPRICEAFRKLTLKFTIASKFVLKIHLMNRKGGEFTFKIILTRALDVINLKQTAVKSEFMNLLINSLSHEIVTPLSEIIQTTSMSLRNLGSSKGSFELEFLNSASADGNLVGMSGTKGSQFSSSVLITGVNQNASRLVYFVKGLLAYNQILNLTFESDDPANFDVRVLLEEVVEVFEARCQQKSQKIEIQCAKETILKSDRKLLSYALYSFLDNAVKFSNVGGLITLCVEYSAETMDCRFKVIDNGIGINEKDLDIIMEMLSNPMASEMTSSSAGLGIGIRIAQAIISMMTHGKSTIGITTKLGFGTTIYFDIFSPTTLEKRSAQELNQPAVSGMVRDEENEVQKYSRERTINQSAQRYRSIYLDNLSKLENHRIKKNVPKPTKDGITSIVAPVWTASFRQFNSASKIQVQVQHQSNFMSHLSGASESHSSYLSKPPDEKIIMVVDDEVFVLEFIREILEDLDFEVYTCCDADRAIERASMLTQMNKKVLQVYMDFNMPKMNGAECCKVLKSENYRKTFSKTNFTALTAQDDKMVRDKFAQAGVLQFMTKPVSFGLLQQHLKDNNILAA